MESLSQQVETLRGASQAAGLTGADRVRPRRPHPAHRRLILAPAPQQERKDTANDLVSQVARSTESFRDAVQSTLQKERDFLHAAEAAHTRCVRSLCRQW